VTARRPKGRQPGLQAGLPPVRADLAGAGVTTGGQNAGGRRALAGKYAEDSLGTTHRIYQSRGYGLIVKQHVPGVRVVRELSNHRHESLLKPAGGAVVDYVGWMNDTSSGYWGADYPVAFDAKAFGGHAVTYEHDPEQRHQLEFLIEAHTNRAWAFLLLLDDASGHGWMIHQPHQFKALWRGEGVKVCARSSAPGSDGFSAHHLPDFAAVRHQATLDQAPGWDWLPLARRVFLQDSPRR
jgi:penicillin-binding protein-related factor A (putative recombinase)